MGLAAINFIVCLAAEVYTKIVGLIYSFISID